MNAHFSAGSGLSRHARSHMVMRVSIVIQQSSVQGLSTRLLFSGLDMEVVQQERLLDPRLGLGL